AQDLLVEQVPHADADAVDLVGVRRADPAARRADAPLAEEPLRDLVDRAVVGRDDVRAARHEQARHVDAALDQRVELLEQHLDVDDDTVGDDRHHAGRQDAGRQQVQRILLVTDDDRVPRVVATVELHHVVDAGAQEVRRLSLALIAPLGTDEHHAWHGSPPSRIAWSLSRVRSGGAGEPRPSLLRTGLLRTGLLRAGLLRAGLLRAGLLRAGAQGADVLCGRPRVHQERGAALGLRALADPVRRLGQREERAQEALV